jgi:hypothetical protein
MKDCRLAKVYYVKPILLIPAVLVVVKCRL